MEKQQKEGLLKNNRLVFYFEIYVFLFSGLFPHLAGQHDVTSCHFIAKYEHF